MIDFETVTLARADWLTQGRTRSFSQSRISRGVSGGHPQKPRFGRPAMFPAPSPSARGGPDDTKCGQGSGAVSGGAPRSDGEPSQAWTVQP